MEDLGVKEANRANGEAKLSPGSKAPDQRTSLSRDIVFPPRRDSGRVAGGVGEQDRSSREHTASVVGSEAVGLPA